MKCVDSCPNGMQIVGSDCACNSSAYFNPLLKTCFACSSINSLCETCSYDNVNFEGECDSCS